MKKLLSIALILLVIGACKKKKEDETPTPAETKGSVEFNVYTKLFETQTPVNAAQVKVAKSQSDLNAGTLLATLTTDNTGKVKWEDQEQGSYYYKATYAPNSNDIYTAAASFDVLASGIVTKSVLLKQTAGNCTLSLKVLKYGTTTAIAGANVSIAYSPGNAVTNPLTQSTSGADGIVTFSGLNVDTILVRVQATVNSVAKDTSGFGYYLPTNDRNVYNTVEIK